MCIRDSDGTVPVMEAHLLPHGMLRFRFGSPSSETGQGLGDAFDSFVYFFQFLKGSGG